MPTVSTIPARAERIRLADLMTETGPDAPTLCSGWSTRDLAAHLVVRERRLDGAVGLIAKPLAGYTERVQESVAQKPWNALVELVRNGPPRLSPLRLSPLDRAANTIEFFVHHEDVRRAAEGWSARDLPDDLVADLDAALRRATKLLGRKAPAGMRFEPSDGSGEPFVGKQAEPMVTLRGTVGELVLFIYGRQAHAGVELEGPDDAVEALRTHSFGI